jgi:hypothetical protein
VLSDADLEAIVTRAQEVNVRPEVMDELEAAGWFSHRVPRLDGAKCAGHEKPDLWHHRRRSYQERAIAICETCPALIPCLLYALHNETDGVWGGVALKPALSLDLCPLGHDDWVTRSNGRRYCRTCQLARQRARWAIKTSKEEAC